MVKRHERRGVQRVGYEEYSRSNADLYRARNRKKGARRWPKIAGICALALVVGIAGWLVSIQMRISGGSITDDLRQSLYNVTNSQPYYVLLLGTDGRPGETNYRSDTIVLMRVDPTNKKVTLVSIPRDTKVSYKGQTMKINGTHTADGAAGVVSAVDTLCGVKISHYVEVSFDGFSTVVDALGGVTVDVDTKIDDEKAGDDVIEPGTQVLNGSQALTYCRSRAFVDGDYTRTRHQRTFITALISQITSTSNPLTLVSVVNAGADMLSTDLSVSSIVAMATQLKGMDPANIYSCTIPSTTATISGQSYVVANEGELAEMMKRVDAGEDPEGPTTMGEGLDGTTL